MYQHHTSMFLVLFIFIVKRCDAVKDYNVTCMEKTSYRIPSGDVGVFTLSNENVNNTEQCQVNIKLIERASIFNRRAQKVEIEVAINPDGGICFYSIDMYIGNPAKNRKITTLDCKNHRTWRGQWPSMEVVLDYHMFSNNVTDVMTKVRFSKCTDCYHIINYPYPVKTEINPYNSRKLTFDACKYYEVSTFNTCRKPYKFQIKDELPVCFEKHNQYSFKKKDTDCTTTISIDNEPALVSTYNNWKPWCIPWNLKGKTVSFSTTGKLSNFCLCTLVIRTNNSQKLPSECVRSRPQTTTKDWSWNNNNVDTSYDSDDDDDNVEIIGILTAVGIFGLCTCVCCCAAQKNRDGDQNGQVLARRNQQQNIYQMKTFDDRDNRSHTAPSAPSYPLLPPQERTFGGQNSNQQILHTGGASNFDGYIPNDSPERRGYQHSYVDGRYQRPETNISSQNIAQNSSDDIEFGLQRPDDRTCQEIEPPPPSYEEACKYAS